ncbi:hypothetical protein R3P38DRAFT_3206025 [Favolaschia claudopus]|uniref:F-box domain-containing protein n=1 Tax=Favolaschia claudopus TaxID=2862362 RepID=A0AAW0APC6_9AGAR
MAPTQLGLLSTAEAAAHLTTLPPDILDPIFQLLYHAWLVDLHRKFGGHSGSHVRFDYERCQGEFLFAVSLSCRYLRAQSMRWIFREVYNWETSRGRVWPQSIWSYIKIVHLRDRTARTSRPLELSVETIRSLPVMLSLVKATIRLKASIPSDLLQALSLAPALSRLEIFQARFDGDFPSCTLAFPCLETLVISICGFKAVAGQSHVDRVKQANNFHSLLGAVSSRLSELRISGDLISQAFPLLQWPHIRTFAITEHKPTPYITLSHLISKMPSLRDLQTLYTAEVPPDRAIPVFPSFHLGDSDSQSALPSCHLLSTATLGNILPGDPILVQLPASLRCLHLRAPVDPFDTKAGFPQHAHFPLNEHAALHQLRYLSDLVELSLDLDSFVTAPLIQQIASALPQLEVVEFSLPRFLSVRSPRRFQEKDRDPAILTTLNLFPHLRHLRITLNFPRTISDPHHSREVTARWFLAGVPTLERVSFASHANMYLIGFETRSWDTWDHSVFDLHWVSPPPTPPPKVDGGHATWEIWPDGTRFLRESKCISDRLSCARV